MGTDCDMLLLQLLLLATVSTAAIAAAVTASIATAIAGLAFAGECLWHAFERVLLEVKNLSDESVDSAEICV
jgi:hypothetical protein